MDQEWPEAMDPGDVLARVHHVAAMHGDSARGGQREPACQIVVELGLFDEGDASPAPRGPSARTPPVVP